MLAACGESVQTGTGAPQAVTTGLGATAVTGGGDPAAGRQLFEQNGCIACHGANLQGVVGPRLAGRTRANLTEDRMRTQIRTGGGRMPSFAQLSDAEITQIIAFIRSVK